MNMMGSCTAAWKINSVWVTVSVVLKWSYIVIIIITIIIIIIIIIIMLFI